MINELRQEIAIVLFKLSPVVKKYPVLNKVLLTAGFGLLYDKFIAYYAENSKEVCFEADINGTKIKILDGSYRLEYYRRNLCGITYEPAFARTLTNLLNEITSPTFVDIGAHIGYFTVYAGNLLGKRGRVISIEPNEYYYGFLSRNVEFNGLRDNVQTFQIALSNKSGKANTGGDEGRDSIESDSGDIEVMTLDKLCEIEKIKPDIIKIDVHGAEYKVLSGMPNILNNCVNHLFIEVHPVHFLQGFNIKDIIDLFDTKKFELLELIGTWRMNDWMIKGGEDEGKIVPISEDFLNPDEHKMLYVRRRFI